MRDAAPMAVGMTILESAPPAVPPSVPTALKPVGIAFLIASVLWAAGVVIEILFARSDSLADGASFVVNEIVFFGAILAFAWALLTGARRGLSGSSVLGKTGLIVTAAAYLLVLFASVLVNVVGLETAAIGLAVGGIALGIGEILAGIGILRHGPVLRPAAAPCLEHRLLRRRPAVRDRGDRLAPAARRAGISGREPARPHLDRCEPAHHPDRGGVVARVRDEPR